MEEYSTNVAFSEHRRHRETTRSDRPATGEQRPAGHSVEHGSGITLPQATRTHPSQFRDQQMERGRKDVRVMGESLSEHEAYRLEDEATDLMKKAKGKGQTLRKTWGILDNGTQVRLATYEITFSELIERGLGGPDGWLVAHLVEAM